MVDGHSVSIVLEKCTSISVEKCTTEISRSIMEKAFIVLFIKVIIFVSEGAGTATGEAKIIAIRILPCIKSHLITVIYLTCFFTIYKGVRYTKDDYYGR